MLRIVELSEAQDFITRKAMRLAEAEQVVAPILERLGYKLERAKTNIGLGRISNVSKPQPKQEEVPVA